MLGHVLQYLNNFRNGNILQHCIAIGDNVFEEKIPMLSCYVMKFKKMNKLKLTK